MSKVSRSRLAGLRLIVVFVILGCPKLVLPEYIPYPGKLAVNVLDVKASNMIYVSFEPWPGFARSVRIKLPDVVVPGEAPEIGECERELAFKALAFTKQFVSVKKVYVKNMRMKTSTDEQAYSDILTSRGSLSEALIKAGLAIKKDKHLLNMPWCE